MQQNSDMITLSDFILPRDNIVVEMLNKKNKYQRHKKCENNYLSILETFHVTMASGSI